MNDKDEDDRCEIDSEDDNNNYDKRLNSRLEESVRSSRTATFKQPNGMNNSLQQKTIYQK